MNKTIIDQLVNLGATVDNGRLYFTHEMVGLKDETPAGSRFSVKSLNGKALGPTASYEISKAKIYLDLETEELFCNHPLLYASASDLLTKERIAAGKDNFGPFETRPYTDIISYAASLAELYNKVFDIMEDIDNGEQIWNTIKTAYNTTLEAHEIPPEDADDYYLIAYGCFDIFGLGLDCDKPGLDVYYFRHTWGGDEVYPECRQPDDSQFPLVDINEVREEDGLDTIYRKIVLNNAPEEIIIEDDLKKNYPWGFEKR